MIGKKKSDRNRLSGLWIYGTALINIPHWMLYFLSNGFREYCCPLCRLILNNSRISISMCCKGNVCMGGCMWNLQKSTLFYFFSNIFMLLLCISSQTPPQSYTPILSSLNPPFVILPPNHITLLCHPLKIFANNSGPFLVS